MNKIFKFKIFVYTFYKHYITSVRTTVVNERHLEYSLVWRYGSVLGKTSLPIHTACHEWAGRAAIINPQGLTEQRQAAIIDVLTYI